MLCAPFHPVFMHGTHDHRPPPCSCATSRRTSRSSTAPQQARWGVKSSLAGFGNCPAATANHQRFRFFAVKAVQSTIIAFAAIKIAIAGAAPPFRTIVLMCAAIILGHLLMNIVILIWAASNATVRHGPSPKRQCVAFQRAESVACHSRVQMNDVTSNTTK